LLGARLPIMHVLSITVGALVAAALLAPLVAFWRRPLAAFGWLSRRSLARAGLRQQFVDTSVGRQSLFVGGTGRLVVLVHGAGDQAGTWARVVPALLPSVRLIVPDLAGHGDSDPRRGALSVGTVLEGFAEALAAVGGGAPAVVVGNSLGAWIATLYGLRHPDRVERLVLVNGGALEGDRSDVTFTPSSREEARVTMEALLGTDAARVPNFVLDDLIRVCRHGPLGRLAQTAAEMDRFMLEGRLHELSVPVDLLWGVEDRVFPLAYAERMAREFRAVRLTPLEGCGHVPHRSRPRAFGEVLVGLLDREAPKDGHVAC
jgi:pimeloyl-ACP methyl ester carboxylesterase